MEPWAKVVSAASVNSLIEGYGDDCALVSLAIYLGLDYPDVVRAVTITDKKQGTDGLSLRAIVRTASLLGYRLIVRRKFDLDEDYGIVVIADHCGVLRNGLVMDRQTVWELADWLAHNKATTEDCDLLVVKE